MRRRKFPSPAGSDAGYPPPPQRQAGRAVGTDDDVIEELDFHQFQSLLDARRDGTIGGGGLRIARRVVAEGNDDGGIQDKRPASSFSQGGSQRGPCSPTPSPCKK